MELVYQVFNLIFSWFALVLLPQRTESIKFFRPLVNPFLTLLLTYDVRELGAGDLGLRGRFEDLNGPHVHSAKERIP